MDRNYHSLVNAKAKKTLLTNSVSLYNIYKHNLFKVKKGYKRWKNNNDIHAEVHIFLLGMSDFWGIWYIRIEEETFEYSWDNICEMKTTISSIKIHK